MLALLPIALALLRKLRPRDVLIGAVAIAAILAGLHMTDPSGSLLRHLYDYLREATHG